MSIKGWGLANTNTILGHQGGGGPATILGGGAHLEGGPVVAVVLLLDVEDLEVRRHALQLPLRQEPEQRRLAHPVPPDQPVPGKMVDDD